MNIKKNKILLIIFMIIFINSVVSTAYFSNLNQINDNYNYIHPKTSAGDSIGKVFSTMSLTATNCYINRENPDSNVNPSIYIPNYYPSQADLTFEDIIAYNYTKIIESESTQFITSSEHGPIYVYQKFYIETNRYVNNVSIFIQDINFGSVSEEYYWEAAILNCTNNIYGTPNPDEVLGSLSMRPPLYPDIGAQWLYFLFDQFGNGPIFLNISHTQKIIENGINKCWFALRIKIPKTSGSGSNMFPKFLYFNPDGGDISNIGEGDTFIKSPDLNTDNYTINNVSQYNINEGTFLNGNLDSFKEQNDNDRFIVESTLSPEYDVNFTTRIELNNYTEFSIQQLINIINFLGINWWYQNHFWLVFSIDIYIVVNVSDSSNIQQASILYERQGKGQLTGFGNLNFLKNYNITDKFNGSLTQEEENLLLWKIRDPHEKLMFLNFINTTYNNSIVFRIEFNGDQYYNISIDQLKVEMGDLSPLNTIQPYDPLIRKNYYCYNTSLNNGTLINTGTDPLNAIKIDDGKTYEAQAETNNITAEFKAEIINDIPKSLWYVEDLYDWIIKYPNPIIPQIDIFVSSNTSFSDLNALDLAELELYKGDFTSDYLTEEQNENDWIMISETNKTYAYNKETLNITTLDLGSTWILLQYLNYTGNNTIRLRLRYSTSNPSEFGFNISIDEFNLRIHIQNAISSDICSKLGFGLNPVTLKPEDIEMKCFNSVILNLDNRTGHWSGYVPNEISTQGIFEFNITSLWRAISFSVSGTCQIYKLSIELDFPDDIETQYMTGEESFTVEVTDGSGNPVPNLEILFELLDADDDVIDEDKATTNSEGEATGSLELKDVGSGFYIRAYYEKEGIYASDDIDSDEFRTVDDFTLFMDNFLLVLPYILIGLAGLFVFVTIRHQKLKKLRAKWSKDAQILEDLLKISHIMIIHKEAGLTLYNKQISMDLDADLIGGFITAISQFRSEIKKPTEGVTKGAGFEMDYHDFKIDMTDGDFIRTALILEGVPSQILKDNQQQFTETFEAKFKPLLADFKGDIKPFVETDNLIERYFNLSFMYPLQLAKHRQFSKLNKLETVLIEVAEQMQKERKYFFVSSLLNYGIAGRKESKNQIISAIISLKKRGLFVPIENI